MSKQLDMKELLRQFNEDKAKVSGAGFFKLVDGENKVRLVTFVHDGREMLYVQQRVHFVDKAGTHICSKPSTKVCPICDYVSGLRKAGYDDLAQQLSARTRFYFNVLVKEQLHVLEVGQVIWNAVMAYFADEDYGNIADLAGGRDIKIVKSGSRLETEYQVLVAPKPSAAKLPSDPVDLVILKQPEKPEELERVLYSQFEKLPEQNTADKVVSPPSTTDGDGFDWISGKSTTHKTEDAKTIDAALKEPLPATKLSPKKRK
jgi:hypothetical protein